MDNLLDFSRAYFHTLQADALPMVTVGNTKFLVVPVNLHANFGKPEHVATNANKLSASRPLNIAVSVAGMPEEHLAIADCFVPNAKDRALLHKNVAAIGEQLRPREAITLIDAKDLPVIAPEGPGRISCVGLLVKYLPRHDANAGNGDIRITTEDNGYNLYIKEKQVKANAKVIALYSVIDQDGWNIFNIQQLAENLSERCSEDISPDVTKVYLTQLRRKLEENGYTISAVKKGRRTGDQPYIVKPFTPR